MAAEFISVSTVLEAVAAAFDIEVRNIRAPRRQPAFIAARQAACLLARELTEQTLVVIGRTLAGCDHTTVLHHINEARARLATDPEYALKVGAARQAALMIASSSLARLLADPDAVAIAHRITDNPIREALRVSALESAAMAARLLTLEDVAASTFQLLECLSASERARHAEHLQDILTTLAALGYAAGDETSPRHGDHA
jgi:chromosomal replication initiator protein